jgi:hypothetical protein
MSAKPDMHWEWNWPRLIDSSCSRIWLDRMQSGQDHGPGFVFGLQIGRVILLEFGYYNTEHAD